MVLSSFRRTTRASPLVSQGYFKGAGDFQLPAGFPVPGYEFPGDLLLFFKLLYTTVQRTCLAPMAAFPETEPLEFVEIDFFVQQGANEVRGLGWSKSSLYQWDLLLTLQDFNTFCSFQIACFWALPMQ